MAGITVSAQQDCWVVDIHFTGEPIKFADGVLNDTLLAELRSSSFLTVTEDGAPVEDLVTDGELVNSPKEKSAKTKE